MAKVEQNHRVLTAAEADIDRIAFSCVGVVHFLDALQRARMLRDQLNRSGLADDRKHVGTLMKRMGVDALYRRGLTINRANQVWALDTTYHSSPDQIYTLDLEDHTVFFRAGMAHVILNESSNQIPNIALTTNTKKSEIIC